LEWRISPLFSAFFCKIELYHIKSVISQTSSRARSPTKEDEEDPWSSSSANRQPRPWQGGFTLAGERGASSRVAVASGGSTHQRLSKRSYSCFSLSLSADGAMASFLFLSAVSLTLPCGRRRRTHALVCGTASGTCSG
jgi:hypothetical protein